MSFFSFFDFLRRFSFLFSSLVVVVVVVVAVSRVDFYINFDRCFDSYWIQIYTLCIVVATERRRKWRQNEWVSEREENPLDLRVGSGCCRRRRRQQQRNSTSSNHKYTRSNDAIHERIHGSSLLIFILSFRSFDRSWFTLKSQAKQQQQQQKQWLKLFSQLITHTTHITATAAAQWLNRFLCAEDSLGWLLFAAATTGSHSYTTHYHSLHCGWLWLLTQTRVHYLFLRVSSSLSPLRTSFVLNLTLTYVVRHDVDGDSGGGSGNVDDQFKYKMYSIAVV